MSKLQVSCSGGLNVGCYCFTWKGCVEAGSRTSHMSYCFHHQFHSAVLVHERNDEPRRYFDDAYDTDVEISYRSLYVVGFEKPAANVND